MWVANGAKFGLVVLSHAVEVDHRENGRHQLVVVIVDGEVQGKLEIVADIDIHGLDFLGKHRGVHEQIGISELCEFHVLSYVLPCVLSVLPHSVKMAGGVTGASSLMVTWKGTSSSNLL